MPRPPAKSLLAAEMYLACGGNGFRRRGVTLAECAKRYGVALSTVFTVVQRLRRKRKEPEELGATPEDECTL